MFFSEGMESITIAADVVLKDDIVFTSLIRQTSKYTITVDREQKQYITDRHTLKSTKILLLQIKN